ncbi:hypothetical protein ABZ368_15550 [Streptomyces sp. NPDC005908]|uniref:hypothetical protein n=1 Tax=Streptomyces sp. NPDC005908 TaxID=3157084 RepID=UPI0033F80A12
MIVLPGVRLPGANAAGASASGRTAPTNGWSRPSLAPKVRPKDGRAVLFVVEPDRAQLAEPATRR